MKTHFSSIAKLLLPALLLAFFHTQAGAQITVGGISGITRQLNASSGAAGIYEGDNPVWFYGPYSQSSTNDVGLFNPGPITSSASLSPYANATTTASQDSNIDTSDPTHLHVTAALSESTSFYAEPLDAQNSEGIADGQGLSVFSLAITIAEPFTLTLSNVTTTRDANLAGDSFSNTVTLTQNSGSEVVAQFGEDSNGTYLQGGSYSISGAAGYYWLSAVVQDNFTDTAQGAISSGDRSASFDLDVTVAPEPSSALLLLASGAMLLLRRRRAAV